MTLGFDELQIIWLSAKVGFLSTVICLPFAFLTSYLIVKFQFKGKIFLETFINLPLIVPPVSTGFLLILLFGKNSFLGKIIYYFFQITIPFSIIAAIIASMVVSFPLIVGNIKVSLEISSTQFEKIAKSLGANNFEVFKRITLPLIFPGMINGFILGFARSLGEFGATITFAGNISGETRTIPLAVYSLLQTPGKETQANLLVCISIIISFIALLVSNLIQKYNSNNYKTK